MTHEKDLSKWLPFALALPAEQASVELRVPKDIFLRRASSYASHVDVYWDPSDPLLPRFQESDPTLQRFAQIITTELEELRRGAFQADYNWQVSIDPKRPQGLVDKAVEYADELTTVYSYALDDGIEETADEQLSNLKEEHADDGQSIAALSKELFDLATFGKSIEPKLAKLGSDFNIKLLDDALELSEQLAKLPEGPATPSPESKRLLGIRNRFFSLIAQRLELIQTVAAFKFRKHPEILQKFANNYERRRSLAALKRKQAAASQQQAAEQQRVIDQKKAEIREKLLEEQLTAEVREELTKK